jgi:tetratricopeptide (TPR) repeat protein
MKMRQSVVAAIGAVCMLTAQGRAGGIVPGADPAIEVTNKDVRSLAMATHGLDLLMNGKPDAAIDVFQKIEESDPQSALGYLLEADAVWWKIYLTTGNLVDPDVFEVVSSNSTPYDSHFKDLIRAAIFKAKEEIRAGHDAAQNYLYEGMAYALRARLAGLRGIALPTARAGKKMRSLLLKALWLNPNLADAYLGIGTYNYFVATLPGIIRLLRWLIGLPGGNRELGLQQLKDAANHGVLTRGEAEFYLAKDYSRASERHYGKSLEIFQRLCVQYPQNGLWKLLSGSLEIRLGHRSQGEALFRQVFQMTRAKTSATGRAMHRSALEALERLHSGGNVP